MTLMLLAVVIFRYQIVLWNEIVMVLGLGNALIISANGPVIKGPIRQLADPGAGHRIKEKRSESGFSSHYEFVKVAGAKQKP
jgi:hypothetical protein